MGPGTEMPTAAVFDFSTLADSSAAHRGQRVRLLEGRNWLPLLDVGWRSEPLREPWRIVPHGPLKLMVGEGGDLSGLVIRGDPTVRLEPDSTIAEDSPDAGTQLVLRKATLRVDDEPTEGVVLDAQLGRTVEPVLARELARLAQEDDSAAAEEARGRGDTAAAGAGATAISWQGAQAFLLDDTGYYLVFVASTDGDLAWIHDGEGDDVRRGVHLEATAWEDFHEAGVQFPTAWRFTASAGDLAGELKTEVADRSVLHGMPDISALGYAVVSGWIEDHGMRRGVFGLVRQVR